MSKVQKRWVQKSEKKKTKEKWFTKYVKRRRRSSRIAFTVKKHRKAIKSRNVFKKSRSSIRNNEEKDPLDNPLEGGDFDTKQKCEICARTEERNLSEAIHEEILHKHREDIKVNTSHEAIFPPPEDQENKIKNDFSENVQNYSVEETHDSIIHVPEPDNDDYELDEEDEKLQSNQKRRSSLNLPHTIIMSQYQSALHPPYEGGEYSESENEDFDTENSNDTEEEEQIYIDSGLRPLKPNESKLLLDKRNRPPRRLPLSTEDEVVPLLKQIPSSVYGRKKKPRKKKSEEKQPSEVSSESSVTEEPEDDKEEEKRGYSTTTITSHPSGLIDTRPLLKFDEPEDVKEKPGDYSRTKITSQPSGLIDTRPLLKFGEPEDDSKRKIKMKKFWKKKDDICVHTKEVPESKQKDFSSTAVRDKKKRSLFGFFRKNDFCVHTVEPGKDTLSVVSSLLSKEIPESRLKDSVATTVEGVKVKDKKKRSFFGFFRKNDFCVHTVEPGKDTLSVESSRLFFFNTDEERHSETKIFDRAVQKSKPVREEHKFRHLAPIEETGKQTRSKTGNGYRSRSSSRSSSRSNLSLYSSQKSILLTSNKERRRSRINNFPKMSDFNDNSSSKSRWSNNMASYSSSRRKKNTKS